MSIAKFNFCVCVSELLAWINIFWDYTARIFPKKRLKFSLNKFHNILSWTTS